MTERKDMDTNLDAPATRRDLRELRDEMGERFREQDARIDERMDQRFREQDARIDARMDQRFREQDARIDARITKQFEVLADALLDRIDRRMEERFAVMDRRMEERFAVMDRRMEERFAVMSQDLARMLGVSAEATRGELRIIDDQYKDLPGRVARLEDAVFKPAPRRAPRKRRSA